MSCTRHLTIFHQRQFPLSLLSLQWFVPVKSSSSLQCWSFNVVKINFQSSLLLKVHGADKAYSCDICGHQVNTLCSLRSHKLHKHPAKIEMRVCEQCGEEVQSHYYDFHLRNKHAQAPPKTFPCENCPEVFKSKKGLLAHLRKVHNIGDYQNPRFEGICPDCGRKFTSKDYFFAHVFEFHGMELEGLKKRPCPHCDKVFYVKSALDTHIQLHTGQKKWKCPECDYSTRFSANVRKHRKNVHGKKTETVVDTMIVNDNVEGVVSGQSSWSHSSQFTSVQESLHGFSISYQFNLDTRCFVFVESARTQFFRYSLSSVFKSLSRTFCDRERCSIFQFFQRS